MQGKVRLEKMSKWGHYTIPNIYFSLDITLNNQYLGRYRQSKLDVKFGTDTAAAVGGTDSLWYNIGSFSRGQE